MMAASFSTIPFPEAFVTTPKAHLAIDLGASSGRVLAGIVENGRLKLEELNRFPNGPVLGGDGHYT